MAFGICNKNITTSIRLKLFSCPSPHHQIPGKAFLQKRGPEFVAVLARLGAPELRPVHDRQEVVNVHVLPLAKPAGSDVTMCYKWPVLLL